MQGKYLNTFGGCVYFTYKFYISWPYSIWGNIDFAVIILSYIIETQQKTP